MAPKKGKAKKAPAFYTDTDSLAPFNVQARDIVKTSSLGLKASVLGVKKSSQEGGNESSTLWVEHRCGYRSPTEPNGVEHCSHATQAWRDVQECQQMIDEDFQMREKIHELNVRFKLGLLDPVDRKKKK